MTSRLRAEVRGVRILFLDTDSFLLDSKDGLGLVFDLVLIAIWGVVVVGVLGRLGGGSGVLEGSGDSGAVCVGCWRSCGVDGEKSDIVIWLMDKD